MGTRDFVADATATVVVNIGQIDSSGKRALAAAVRQGKIVKWRGHWHPIAGAPWGIGPLKTCYGPHGYLADIRRIFGEEAA